jgi:hypothetical protein
MNMEVGLAMAVVSAEVIKSQIFHLVMEVDIIQITITVIIVQKHGMQLLKSLMVIATFVIIVNIQVLAMLMLLMKEMDNIMYTQQIAITATWMYLIFIKLVSKVTTVFV